MATRERRAELRAIATKFVEAINSGTVCARCGAQPVEWHHESHTKDPNSRVSSLRTQGASIARIKKEIERCTPLCRRCHMAMDGRMQALAENHPYRKGETYTPARPCVDCGRLTKPRRRGRCYGCYVKWMGIR